VTTILVHFLETTLKNRPVEWEPQYNLTPVTFADIQMVQNSKLQDAGKVPAPAPAKNAAALPKPKDGGDPKAKAMPKAPASDLPPPPAPTPEKSD
jgi:hypothetical protein